MPKEESIKSVQRAMQLLNCYTIDKPLLGITELSKTLNVSKSTIHRVVTSMQKEGFLIQEPVSQKYSLGYNILRLSEIIQKKLDIRSIALPIMIKLRDQTDETVGLNMIFSNCRVCVEKVESTHDLRRFIEVGQYLPLYPGASGKVLLAFQDHKTIENILHNHLKVREGIHFRGIIEDLSKIRVKGYCITDSERVAGATSLSAPIFGQGGGILASLTISGPTLRFSFQKNEDYLELLLEATRNISQLMGFR